MRRLFVATLLAVAACADDADLEVTSVTSLGVMEKPASIDGRDGGTSGRFRGRSVWVYGDSVATEMGTYPSTWRNNTMSWTDDLDASDGVTGFVQPEDELGAAREFFPRTPDEESFNAAHFAASPCEVPCGARYAIWGSGPLDDPARDRAILTYAKVYSEPGEFNFSLIGTSIAVWRDFEVGPERPEVDSDLDDPTLIFDAHEEGEFGIPTVAGDTLYLFSCSGGHQGDNECILARAPLADVLRRDAYEFRSDDGWSTGIGDATTLFEGSPNMTVHFSAHLDRWIAVYITWGEIMIRTAPRIEGPWSGETTIYEPDEDNALHALAHAELQERGGEVEYISYLSDEFHLLRVELDPR